MQVKGDPEGWFSPASVAGNGFSSGLRCIWFWFPLTDSGRFGKTEMGSIAILRHPPAPQRLQLLVQRRSALAGAAPVGSHAVVALQAVLMPGELRERDEPDAFLVAASLVGGGEDLAAWS
jgi:hypothetical protein